MPVFEMDSFLFPVKERDQAIRGIQEGKPRFIFVDSWMEKNLKDPWERLCKTEFAQKERLSRLGRYQILQQVFEGVGQDYEKVEEGGVARRLREK